MAFAHRPTDNLAREDIQHGCQVQPSLSGWDVGEIRHPFLVGTLSGEVLVQDIWRDGQPRVGTGGLFVALAAFFEEQGEIRGLLDAIATAAETDEQISEGKALSEREEAVLQALEWMTRGDDGTIWIKAVALREKVARLIGQPVEKMGDAQWVGHILKRLHLIDESGRKRGMDGIAYAVRSFDVIDMMRRYDVPTIHETR